LVRLETSPHGDYARNRGSLPPGWIPFVLDVHFEGQEAHRKKADIQRGSAVDPPNEAENPTWGALRIHGELLMLAFEVCERTISRWMKGAPRGSEPSRRWLRFLRSHREAIIGMDFFTVPTITFGVLYCFFVIAQVREAFPFELAAKTAPILDWGREHRAAELPPSPPVAYALILDSEGCTSTFGRPDPDARAAEVRLDHLRPYPYIRASGIYRLLALVERFLVQFARVFKCSRAEIANYFRPTSEFWRETGK